jgi:hypothetical protein
MAKMMKTMMMGLAVAALIVGGWSGLAAANDDESDAVRTVQVRSRSVGWEAHQPKAPYALTGTEDEGMIHHPAMATRGRSGYAVTPGR